MVFLDLSVACLAALSASSFPLILMRAAVFPGYGAMLVYHISDLVSIGRFSLMFSMASIELNVSIYITHLMSSLS